MWPPPGPRSQCGGVAHCEPLVSRIRYPMATEIDLLEGHKDSPRVYVWAKASTNLILFTSNSAY